MGHRYPKRTQLKYTKQRYRVGDWRQYDVGLGRRGDGPNAVRDRSSHNSYYGCMRTISAIDAKNRFGQLLEAAQREPVTVTKQGRPAAVMLSVEDYERMCGMARDRLLDSVRQMQEEAAAAGLTEKVLDELLMDER